MLWNSGGRSLRATRCLSRPGVLLAAVCAMALAACTIEDRPGVTAGQPRGATVAFESIDGPPADQFRLLVNDINNEVQTRQLAVLSRESSSAYRVRGYLAAKVERRETTISWIWDVFDRDGRRALRITGEETSKVRHRDAWSVADEAMLRRIARSSIDQLAAFLTSPEVAPSTPDSAPRMVVAGTPDTSPEAAGIFRIFQPHADPASTEGAEPAAAAEPVPLPPRRPPADTVVSAGETPTLMASRF
jgi:hypothetical protein